MKDDFPPHQITISQEEYEQLIECRALLKEIYFENCIVGNNVKKWDITPEQRQRADSLHGYD